jgi:hypothetical protein
MVRVFLVGALALAVASFSTVSAQIIGDEGPSQLNVVRTLVILLYEPCS